MMDYEPPVSQLLTLGGPKTLFGLGKGSDYAEFGFRAEHVPVLVRMITDMD